MLYDITPPIGPELRVWPGDTRPSREVLREIGKGDTITLSTLRSTVHLGAHADAPSHYAAGGRAIEQQALETYLGRCQVVHVAADRRSLIRAFDLMTPISAPRLLIRTGTYPDQHHVGDDFAALAPELVHELARLGVILIGVDTPSVDLFDSKDLPAHRAFAECDIAILEGLRLDDVPEGEYELIALPLPLVGFDASPVRAVLRSLR